MTNLYANSVFEDNPTCLWALDEALPATPTGIITRPSTIPTVQTNAKIANAFGNSRFPAYYMSNGTVLYVRDGGIPLVFGSSSVTSVLPNTDQPTEPSVIFPGFGFLNNDGRAKTITFEAWLRITTNTHYPRRIIGPIVGTDGLYVNGPFLTLKVGDNIGSHYIGEWDRPMLVDIYYSQSSAGLILNGEQVISLSFDYKDLSLPAKTSNAGKDQDWIGIFAHTNVPLIQLDCVAIYPYQVSTEKAKLHYVKGQSVESPELKNSSNSDVPIIVDHQMSKYANNYSYPGTGRWQNGAIDNVSTDGNRLSAPNYSLPTIVFQNPQGTEAQELKTLSGWYKLQESLPGQTMTTTLTDGTLMDNSVFFSINPTQTANVTTTDGGANTATTVSMWANGHIYFDNFNLLLGDTIEAIYGVFKVAALPATKQVLFKITNNLNEYFEASINNSANISYVFGSPAGVVETFTSSGVVNTTNKFVAGVNISQLVTASTGSQLASFFANRSSLKMYFGATDKFENTFTGNIYKIGFCNTKNLNKISTSFEDGKAKNLEADRNIFDAHFASYTLIGVTTFGSFALDIAIAGSWEDYVPLTLLAKNIITSTAGAAETNEYRLSTIQHNIDYPNISNINNALIKEYVEIKDLGVSTVSSSQIDKDKVVLSGGPFASNVITFTQDSQIKWENTSYQVDNNSLLFPPPTSGTYVSGPRLEERGLSTLIEMYVPGIIRNPLSIRSLELSAQAMNNSTIKTPIGTKFGKDVYSYSDSGSADYAYPFYGTVYKSSTPYLYLTKFSGFRGAFGSGGGGTNTLGIEIPINKFAQDKYQMNYIQMAIYTDKNFATSGDRNIFSVKDNSKTIFINYSSSTGTTAKLEAKSGSVGGSTYSDVKFYVDGKELTAGNDIVIHKGQWHMIGIKFSPLLSFDSIDTGYIRVGATQFVVNNIVDYQIPEALLRSTQFFDTWGEYVDPALADADNNWANVLSISSTLPLITGAVSSSDVVTYTTASAHGLTTGDRVTVTNLTAAYNASNVTTTVITPTTFSATVAGSGTGTAADQNGNFVIIQQWQNTYIDSVGAVGEVLNPTEIYNSYIKSNTVLADELNTKMTVAPSQYLAFLGNRWQTYSVIPL